jgi:hypothetical protein
MKNLSVCKIDSILENSILDTFDKILQFIGNNVNFN